MPLEENDSLVQFKLKMLERALPASSAVVFGDVWRVDGGYTVECAQRGVEQVLLVDSLETPGWQRARLENPQIDFRKGDFSDPLFMSSLTGRFEICVLFDILLHQPALLGTITEMVRMVGNRLCIVQPMLVEQETPGTLVYLPGNPQGKELYPLEESSHDYRVFEVDAVDHSHWIWAMTRSFLTSALEGEGFELAAEETHGPLPNPSWEWWGAVFERKGEPSPGHWSNHRQVPGLYSGDW
ncbi:MAG: class I SAM-dependent methyltransferase [Solirubrobacterales bacterium]